MPIYVYGSSCGLVAEQARPVVDRDLPSPCPDCNGLLRRDFSRELRTITIAPVPMNFYTQWYDVYDQSPREMAKRHDIDRYDPSLPNKPPVSPVKFDLPRDVPDVDALIKHIAPVDGQNETVKLQRRVAPVEGEKAYT